MCLIQQIGLTCKALHEGLSISYLIKKSRLKEEKKTFFRAKKYTALVETLLVKTMLCGEWENKIELRASGNNVMRNRVMRGLGVI